MIKEKILTEERFIEIIEERKKQADKEFNKEMFSLWLFIMLCFILALIGAFALGAYYF